MASGLRLVRRPWDNPAAETSDVSGGDRKFSGCVPYSDSVSDDGLDSEYENGIADVLAFLAGPNSVVERNVRIVGRRSQIKRQVDVLVTTSVVGLGTTRVVVDCKRRQRKIDVPEVQSFNGFLEDVGADGGVLVATSGYSEGAELFAAQARGLRLYVMTVDELVRWQPPGTVHFDYEVSRHNAESAARMLRRAGFRVTLDRIETSDGNVVLSSYQHFGTTNPGGDVQEQARSRVLQALQRAGVREPLCRASGITISGGTPLHGPIQVTLAGQPFVKVFATSVEEVEKQLEIIATGLLGGVSGAREALSFVKPEGWPMEVLFGGWKC